MPAALRSSLRIIIRGRVVMRSGIDEVVQREIIKRQRRLMICLM